VQALLEPAQPAGGVVAAVDDPGQVTADRDRQGDRRADDEQRQKPHGPHGGGLSALEPLGAQQRHEEIDEQQEGDQGGENLHGGSFHTRSQPATKANSRPNVASPRRNRAGSQIARSIVDSPPLSFPGGAWERTARMLPLPSGACLAGALSRSHISLDREAEP